MASDGHHKVACSKCGGPTYRKGGLCRFCEPFKVAGKVCGTIAGPVPTLAAPSALPEDYLRACVEEFLKRHKERLELIARLAS